MTNWNILAPWYCLILCSVWGYVWVSSVQVPQARGTWLARVARKTFRWTLKGYVLLVITQFVVTYMYE